MDPTILGLVKAIIEIILDFIPSETAKTLIDQAAVDRANRIADTAEVAKVGLP